MTAKQIAQQITECFKRGNKVLIAGNGGLASQSNHFAGELVGKFKRDRIALPVISLASNQSILTAIANDFGFEYIFSRQIEALGKPGDLLITLSTSGKSKNCLMAYRTSWLKGMDYIDFPRKGKDTPSIQEYQLKLMHKVCGMVEQEFI